MRNGHGPMGNVQSLAGKEYKEPTVVAIEAKPGPAPLKATNPKFEALLMKMREIHNKKSADYANDKNRYANFENTAISAGTSVDVVFRTFIGVKLARLSELAANGKEPLNESVQDTLLDLAVYAALYASYYL